MYKQGIARLICFLTIFLLSSNVLLSASNFTQRDFVKLSVKKTSAFSVADGPDQGIRFVVEKDPFESVDFFAVLPEVPKFVIVFFEEYNIENHYFGYSGPFPKTIPIWILTRQILI